MYLEGSFKVDSWIDKRTELEKEKLKIVARKICFVAPFQGFSNNNTNFNTNNSFPNQYNNNNSFGGINTSSPSPSAHQQQQQQQQQYSPSNTEEMWKSLFENPQDYFDNRDSKQNEKQPDFKVSDRNHYHYGQ